MRFESHCSLFLSCGHQISYPMTNSLWVTLPSFLWCDLISWPTGSESYYPSILWCRHLNPWSTECELHCHFSAMHSHHILSTNRKWVAVTLPIFSAIQAHHISSPDKWEVSHTALFLCLAGSSHLIQWPTGSESCSPSFLQAHHISSHDQEEVSQTALFVCHAGLSPLIPWPTACESHCLFSLITSYPMANRKWITLPFSIMQAHHILTHDQQQVSHTALYSVRLITS